MASSVDVVSALGHGLVASQVGPSAGYDAIDIRRAWSPGLQEGAISAGSYEVVQRAAGANLSVDVNASVGDGALVQGDSVTGQGLYRVAPHTAAINVDIAAANATNPRVDIVILEVKDDTHDVGGLNIARVRVISGTATSGATLANRTGAAATPSSAMLLADVLVPALDTTISNSQIRDRRTWARGAFCHIVRNADAGAGDDYSVAVTNYTLVDATNLAPRIECSGVPVRITFEVVVSSVATDYLSYSPQVDSLGINGLPNSGQGLGAAGNALQTGEAPRHHIWQDVFTPSAGSHIFAPACVQNNTGVLLYARASVPLQWTVEEIVRQNTKNNATTSG